MGGAESRENGTDEHDRICGQCSDSAAYQQTFCVKRPQIRTIRKPDPDHPAHITSNGHQSPSGDQMLTTREPIQPDTVAEDLTSTPYFSQPEPPDSWRFHANSEEAVGVGAYFGRLEGQKDSVARVKSLVSGGPAEQTGMIEVGSHSIVAIRLILSLMQ